MKCSFCGARVKKSEEICPECGKFIATKKEHIPTPAVSAKEEIDYDALEKAEEIVKNLDFSDSQAPETETFMFKDYLLLPSVIKSIGGIIVFVVCIFSFADTRSFVRSSSIAGSALMLIFAFFLIFDTVAAIIREKNCFIEITDEKVSGVIPEGTFGTQGVDINISDIVAVAKDGFNSKYSHPKVIIKTKENEFKIRATSQNMLSDLADAVEKRI
ncbi:MAG: hypothetical protein IJF57_00835 [Clostridia bacterium]|nr:hypothetical protein [Clostridia bacterium]